MGDDNGYGIILWTGIFIGVVSTILFYILYNNLQWVN